MWQPIFARVKFEYFKSLAKGGDFFFYIFILLTILFFFFYVHVHLSSFFFFSPSCNYCFEKCCISTVRCLLAFLQSMQYKPKD